ncbi:hypothetical protein [Arhodomonas sp. AD133]|uniref:hypothetical protein n=1 Tax=Arhodomonas sp. AD133 TaxID=3415009 RepID=UPI003EB698A1
MSLSVKTPRNGQRRQRRASSARHAGSPVASALDTQRLLEDNRRLGDSGGVSENNRHAGFRAAFRDEETGRVALPRFRDGTPAPMHLLDGLPDDWVLQRDAAGRITALKPSIIAGFLRDGDFYTREEAAEATGDSSR